METIELKLTESEAELLYTMLNESSVALDCKSLEHYAAQCLDLPDVGYVSELSYEIWKKLAGSHNRYVGSINPPRWEVRYYVEGETTVDSTFDNQADALERASDEAAQSAQLWHDVYEIANGEETHIATFKPRGCR